MNKPLNILQIAAIPGYHNARDPELFALAEDGRIYVHKGESWTTGRWEAMPDLIPDTLETVSVPEDDDATHSPAWNAPLTVDSA